MGRSPTPHTLHRDDRAPRPNPRLVERQSDGHRRVVSDQISQNSRDRTDRRGGFYTYDLVDNAGEPSANRIMEEYQRIAVGDLIPMFHESHGLAIAYRVDSFQASEWMLWVHRPHDDEQPDSTWSWRLSPLPGDRTRLVTRMKQDYRWQTPRLAIFNLILMEFGDFAMERRMLKGIKVRADAPGKTRAPRGGLRTSRDIPELSPTGRRPCLR